MDYKKELTKAMTWLGKKQETIFLGQTVEYNGSPMFASLKNVDMKKRIEMPVAEELQMGISLGMCLEGFIPISIYPRIDFLICATNQLVNHVNHCEEMSRGEFKPGIIIRTMIGNTKPLYPGIQHCSDHTEALKLLCPNIRVRLLSVKEEIFKEYKDAFKLAQRGKSTILIETPQGGDKLNTTWKK